MPETPETELIVIRHGQTVWNAEGRQQGHLDSDLTSLGRRQAEAIADRLADQTFDALYSSDLGRALRTAEYVANKTHLEIVTDQRLRESQSSFRHHRSIRRLECEDGHTARGRDPSSLRVPPPASKKGAGSSTFTSAEPCQRQ